MAIAAPVSAAGGFDTPGQGFGNYALKDFAGLELPPAIDYLQLAPGAQILLCVLLLGLAYVAWRKYQRWLRDAYRREALQLLDNTVDINARLQHMPRLLKAVALQSFPRARVAALSGEEWLAFLDASGRGRTALFQSPTGRQLLTLSYQAQIDMPLAQMQELEALVRAWIAGHRSDV